MARIPRRIAGLGASDLPDAAAFDAYVGPAREITVDPQRGIIALHDGITSGGHRMASSSQGALADTALQPSDAFITPTIDKILKFENVDGGGRPGIKLDGNGLILRRKTSGSTDPSLDTNSLFVLRDLDFAGGTPGYVNAAVSAYTIIRNAAYSSYEWAVLGRVDNHSSLGEPAGGYFQGRKYSDGPTWGSVSEAIDYTGVTNPTTGLVAHEVDVVANGTDANLNRIGVDIVVKKQDPDGVAVTASYGVRVQNNGDSTTIVSHAFSVKTVCDTGFDTAEGVPTIAAYRMAAGQPIAFDVSAIHQLKYDSVTTSLAYYSGGIFQSGLTPDGSILLGNRLKITGTIEASAGAAAAAFLKVIVDGSPFKLQLLSP